MPLETGTYIDSLNASNPLGTGDPKAQGDDHFRLIKSTVKATFPNLTGAMNATQAELNRLVGVTGVTGTGSLALSASPTFTGTLTAATVAATTLTGAGSGITALNASNLASGTVPDARFPATLPALNGSALTNLNGSNIASGTVADGRLSSNVPLKNSSSPFTANQVIDVGGGLVQTVSAAGYAALQIRPDAGAHGWLAFTEDGVADRWLIGIEDADDDLYFAVGNPGSYVKKIRLNSNSGEVTTLNLSASEIGYKGAPSNSQNGDYTLVLTDAGKTVKALPGLSTLTIPNDSAVAFPDQTIIRVHNRTGGNITITKTTSSGLIQNGTAATGARTLGNNSVAEIYKSQADEWIISGPVA